MSRSVASRPSPAARRPGRRAFAGAVALSVIAVLGGAPRAQAELLGGGEDPAGDATVPGAGRDLRAVAISYDRRRGSIVGAYRLGAAPSATEDADVTLVAGRTSPTGCDAYPAIGFRTTTYRSASQWLNLPQASGGGASGTADKRGIGTPTARIEAVDDRLQGGRPDCVVAFLTDPDDASVVHDTAGPFALTPQPVLQVRLRGVPSTLTAGKSRRVRVTVSNVGEARSPRTSLKVAGARGLRATPRTATVAPLAAGASRTVSMRVRLSARARSSTTLRVTGTAGRQRVVAEADVRLRRPSRPGGGGSAGGGGGGASSPKVCTRWFPDLSGETGGSLGLVPC